MTRDTSIALFLMGELALPYAPMTLMPSSVGCQEGSGLGVTEVEELLVHWLGPPAQTG